MRLRDSHFTNAKNNNFAGPDESYSQDDVLVYCHSPLS